VEHELWRAAEESATAFFDFRSAMGGDGSMQRFQKAGMTQGDYMHFNARGGAFMGDRVVYAIWRAFESWARAHPSAGCAD
jgi:hypothetical protein